MYWRDFRETSGVPVEEIRLDMLRAGDYVSIATEKERYDLLVTAAGYNQPILAVGFLSLASELAEDGCELRTPLLYQIALRGSCRVFTKAYTDAEGRPSSRQFPAGGIAGKLALRRHLVIADQSGEGAEQLRGPITSLGWLVAQSSQA